MEKAPSEPTAVPSAEPDPLSGAPREFHVIGPDGYDFGTYSNHGTSSPSGGPEGVPQEPTDADPSLATGEGYVIGPELEAQVTEQVNAFLDAVRKLNFKRTNPDFRPRMSLEEAEDKVLVGALALSQLGTASDNGLADPRYKAIQRLIREQINQEIDRAEEKSDVAESEIDKLSEIADVRELTTASTRANAIKAPIRYLEGTDSRFKTKKQLRQELDEAREEIGDAPLPMDNPRARLERVLSYHELLSENLRLISNPQEIHEIIEEKQMAARQREIEARDAASRARGDMVLRLAQQQLEREQLEAEVNAMVKQIKQASDSEHMPADTAPDDENPMNDPRQPRAASEQTSEHARSRNQGGYVNLESFVPKHTHQGGEEATKDKKVVGRMAYPPRPSRQKVRQARTRWGKRYQEQQARNRAGVA